LRSPYIIALAILIIGCSNPESSSDEESYVEESPVFLSSFDYNPEPPENGELLGIIELGYSGFNSFIVTMDRQDRWRLEKSVYGESYVSSDQITFEQVLKRIEKFKSTMIQFGVPENNINFVASSNAIKSEKVVDIARRLRQMNIGLITVNAKQEGNYALYATVPKEFFPHAFMIDIGSGNTKISWVDKKEPITIETYGSKYYEDGVSDQQARIGIKEAIAQVPAKNKTVCFMVGKIPYLLATITNNRTSRYTILEVPDAYSFREEQEMAGLNLYGAIWEESTISYVFDWDSNFSIGVLMNVN
jgi:hypothetical protein